MTFLLILATVFVWLRVVMIGNDIALPEPLWHYLTWAFALNALALILYATR